MPRARKGAARKRSRNRLLKATKGYWGSRGKLYSKASETYVRAMVYAFRDRKRRKRDFRKLWIIRINAAAKQRGMNYSRFINGLVNAKVEIDRKVLSETAINDPTAFDELVTLSKQHVSS